MKHNSDNDLLNFLMSCESDSLLLIIESVHSRWWSMDSKSYFKSYLEGVTPIPISDSPERAMLSDHITEQIGYFGSHSIAYYLRKLSPFHEEPRTPYHIILKEVEALIYKQFNSDATPSRVASVVQREQNITELLIQNSIGKMSESEISQMLSEAGLDTEAAINAAKKLSKPAAGSALIFTAIKILGKKTVRDILLSILTSMLIKIAGREGAKQVTLRLIKRLPQIAFKRLTGYVGWALLAWDAWMIMGPAKRIMIPFVVCISVLRTAERLKADLD